MRKLILSGAATAAILGTFAGIAAPSAHAFAPRKQFFCYPWQAPGTCVVVPPPTIPTGPTTGTK